MQQSGLQSAFMKLKLESQWPGNTTYYFCTFSFKPCVVPTMPERMLFLTCLQTQAFLTAALLITCIHL